MRNWVQMGQKKCCGICWSNVKPYLKYSLVCILMILFLCHKWKKIEEMFCFFCCYLTPLQVSMLTYELTRYSLCSGKYRHLIRLHLNFQNSVILRSVDSRLGVRVYFETQVKLRIEQTRKPSIKSDYWSPSFPVELSAGR